MPKPRYKTTNWKQYNQSLINRGSLIFWIDEEAISRWAQSKQNKRGRPRRFSDLAITTALMVKRVFYMPLRERQPFGNGVTLEISTWVVRSYAAQISIGKSGMDTTNVHSQKPRCIELSSC
ncbi:transposase [Vibrio sp. Isolate31]|uniref:transposase n=1 Tax=unclassified Vibrio TaxID=2614977 RepID=UPI0031F2F229